MTNPIIETDLGELLNKLNSRFDKLDGKIDKYQDENRKEFKSIDDRLKNLEVSQARLVEKYDAQEKIITELKDSKNKQIWALIILAFTAVVSLVIGLRKFIFYPNV
jgi:predicted nuclease with TOPRIM domain